VSKLLQVQAEHLPNAVAAEERFIAKVLAAETRLSQGCKNAILAVVSRSRLNDDTLALSSGPISNSDEPILTFAGNLAAHPFSICQADADALHGAGFDDRAIVEAIVVAAWGEFLCTLAKGLSPPAEPGQRNDLTQSNGDRGPSTSWADPSGPLVDEVPGQSADIPSCQTLREQFGFVPGLFRIQAAFPEAVTAEIALLEAILFPEDVLGHETKETILLALSAANLNTYGVALHSRVLGTLGLVQDLTDQIVGDVASAVLPNADKSLLLEVSKLAAFALPRSATSEASYFNAPRLKSTGFSAPQVTEAVTAAALANFLNTIQFGLGVKPDFPPRRIFSQKDLYPGDGEARPIVDAVSPPDPDSPWVTRVQNGETDAFEELVRRHTRRIFGTLAGMLGNTDEARDATQDVFLKAFEHICHFEGRSKFSTWLTSIAIHTGTERLRQRRPEESLLDEEGGEENFRPRQVQSWEENPEQSLAAWQASQLVREAILQLPQKYRVAVLLRDINQLTTEEAAAALGLSVPALKARVLRGRLMLRERLAPHFIRQEKVLPDA